MAQCHSCQGKIGVFEKQVKFGPQRLVYCASCGKKEEKKQALEMLYQGDPPREIFRIPKVMVADPYDPQRKILLMGDMLFLDKAVCFAKITECKGPGSELFLLFGLIGAMIAERKKKRPPKPPGPRRRSSRPRSCPAPPAPSRRPPRDTVRESSATWTASTPNGPCSS